MEQVRIIKEMREEDVKRGRTSLFLRPRFMVWENVPGAFSSNGGNDFRAVLEETIRIAELGAPDIPLPPKGRWPMADCWMGDGWSVAYRVLDAQFWGVPQRRRRIALVADFGGHAAPEILFVRKGVCGDFAEGSPPGKSTAAGAGSSIDGTSLTNRGSFRGSIAETLRAGSHGAIPMTWHLQGNATDCGADLYNGNLTGDKATTLTTASCQGAANTGPNVLCLNDQGGSIMGISEDVSGTLRAQEQGHQPIIVAGFKPHAGANAESIGYEEEKSPTIDTGKPMAVFRGGTDYLTGWDSQEKRIFSAKGVSPTLFGSDGGGGRTTYTTPGGTAMGKQPVPLQEITRAE